MGLNLSILGVTDDDLRRVVALAAEENAELDEALLPELEDTRPLWFSSRTDKAWDVIHFSLTGKSSTAAGADDGVFEVSTWTDDPWQYGSWSGVASPEQTRRLADTLAAVPEATMRARLRAVPADAYNAFWADGGWDDHLVADAVDLVAHVRTCADEGLGMWLTVG